MAEVWEDLQCAGFGIYRDTEGFSYGHDAVLLANFVRANRNDHVLDLGAGTGIVSFLVHAKTGAGICAADISERCCRLMEKALQKTVCQKQSRYMRPICACCRMPACLGKVLTAFAATRRIFLVEPKAQTLYASKARMKQAARSAKLPLVRGECSKMAAGCLPVILFWGSRGSALRLKPKSLP